MKGYCVVVFLEENSSRPILLKEKQALSPMSQYRRDLFHLTFEHSTVRSEHEPEPEPRQDRLQPQF